MKRRLAGLLLCAIGLMGTPVLAQDTLAQWAESYDQPATQQKILNLIFTGQVGPLSDAIKSPNGAYLFPKNSQWVQLGAGVIPGKTYLVVSCMLYKRPTDDTINASSYVLRDTTSRPEAISAGYAAHEQVIKLVFPKLSKAFLLLMDSASGKGAQWSASLLELGPDGPRTSKGVWVSPPSMRNFQIGVDTLGGDQEDLLVRVPVDSYKKGEFHYFAYRWNGSRFEPDDFVFDTRLMTLPEDVWKYGTPQ